ncbi:hypothetical protein E2C01_083508 [Portunus trituberculatus]|uniref:Uncharacterized protein n=1 Tax=Portunus trituberculatus TaxID=210409 RepID=A0A5B7J287_PORTR|nr:hypothetical protein [Portunus trituberculatus]
MTCFTPESHTSNLYGRRAHDRPHDHYEYMHKSVCVSVQRLRVGAASQESPRPTR